MQDAVRLCRSKLLVHGQNTIIFPEHLKSFRARSWTAKCRFFRRLKSSSRPQACRASCGWQKKRSKSETLVHRRLEIQTWALQDFIYTGNAKTAIEKITLPSQCSTDRFPNRRHPLGWGTDGGRGRGQGGGDRQKSLSGTPGWVLTSLGDPEP